MPKKSFSFDVTGRKLFDAERVAVGAFVRRYASASESARVQSASSKESRTSGNAPQANVASDVLRLSDQPKTVRAKKQVVKKVVTSSLSATALRGVIFGVTASEQKAATSTKRQVVKAAEPKPVAVKRSASRAVRP
ncbi:hypothetical protein GJ700_02945 [Duganella sp. FT92W]|uniref:Uncharacterized protein n=1 Tax=Pseudoduganella rivuli TaxID=2666085 RepID=A0A7X2IIY9_9BURK|nr:hypothetical protein [Pseudoduganella rivuli]MRV70675.1 hypothetical protein [Pseudoduganella rivuli]